MRVSPAKAGRDRKNSKFEKMGVFSTGRLRAATHMKTIARSGRFPKLLARRGRPGRRGVGGGGSERQTPI